MHPRRTYGSVVAPLRESSVRHCWFLLKGAVRGTTGEPVTPGTSIPSVSPSSTRGTAVGHHILECRPVPHAPGTADAGRRHLVCSDQGIGPAFGSLDGDRCIRVASPSANSKLPWRWAAGSPCERAGSVGDASPGCGCERVNSVLDERGALGGTAEPTAGRAQRGLMAADQVSGADDPDDAAGLVEHGNPVTARCAGQGCRNRGPIGHTWPSVAGKARTAGRSWNCPTISLGSHGRRSD